MKIYYTVYKITNQINSKVYIGAHETRDLDDRYMGSGKLIKHAKKKHGIENFTKEILFVFDTRDAMYAKEAELVTVDFIAENNTYNLKVGGYGGYCPTAGQYHKNMLLTDEEYRINHSKEWIRRLKKAHADGKMRYDGFLGKTHSDETKRAIGAITSKSQTGKGNSQFGSMWIHSLTEQVSKKISKDDPIPEGWLKGRKIKFK